MRTVYSVVLLTTITAGAILAQPKLGDNAALRYWSAFARMQDASITDQQAKELNMILGGIAPYSDLKYRDLVSRNKSALETMARGTAMAECDWGVDYELGSEAPVDYARKALGLGRLNVLYAFHLLQNGDTDGATRALGNGMRFSQDVARGGTLFAALAAKSLLANHLGAMAFATHTSKLSAGQKLALLRAVDRAAQEGIDWEAAVKRDPSAKMLNRDRVLTEKLELNDELQRARSFLR